MIPFIKGLNWPLWFLPVLLTLFKNNPPEYIVARVASMTTGFVVAAAVAIFLPTPFMWVVLPGSWFYGSWWAAYRSGHKKGATVGKNHDVYANCVIFALVAGLRLIVKAVLGF